jgi:hypothetical protein
MNHKALDDEINEPLEEADDGEKKTSVQEQWSMVANAIDIVAFLSTSIYAAVFIIF